MEVVEVAACHMVQVAVCHMAALLVEVAAVSHMVSLASLVH